MPGARSRINGKILEAVHGEVYLSSSQCFLKSPREESLVSRGIKGEMLELVPLSLDDLELDLKGRGSAGGGLRVPSRSGAVRAGFLASRG